MNAVIAQLSRDYSINEAVIYRIIEAESNFDPRAVSHCGARGLMQVTPDTWNWICREYLHVSWDFNDSAFDPERNIRVGMRFLKWIADYLDNHTGQLNDSKERLLLACYNAGPGAVRDHGFRVPPFEETRSYVQKISEPAQ